MGHKGRLPAAFGGHPAQSRGHGGFAAAHIPLHQPVHRGGPGHVFYPLGNGPLLGPGELEGQQPGEVLGILAAGPVEVFLPAAAFDLHQPQLQNQKLLKYQAAAGNGQLFLVPGPVDALQRVAQVAQGVFFPQVLGQAVPHVFRQKLQRGLNRGGNLPGGEPLGGGVDRLQAGGLGLGHKGRGGHGPALPAAGEPAPEQVGFSRPEHLGNKAVVKKGELHLGFPVPGGGPAQEHAPPGPDLAGAADNLPPDNHRPVQGSPGNGQGGGPVHIVPGVEPEQVAHCGRAQLLEELGPLFAHAPQLCDIQFKQGSQPKPSFRK